MPFRPAIPLKASPPDSIKLCAAEAAGCVACLPPCRRTTGGTVWLSLPRFDLKNILIGRAHRPLSVKRNIPFPPNLFDCVYNEIFKLIKNCSFRPPSAVALTGDTGRNQYVRTGNLRRDRGNARFSTPTELLRTVSGGRFLELSATSFSRMRLTMRGLPFSNGRRSPGYGRSGLVAPSCTHRNTPSGGVEIIWHAFIRRSTGYASFTSMMDGDGTVIRRDTSDTDNVICSFSPC